jgi:putative tryptophan/tyrosine transport system substrate-binding protein
VVAKRLELLLELAPSATLIGYLHNPTNPVFAETETREVQVAARTLGLPLLMMQVAQERSRRRLRALLSSGLARSW